MSRINISELDAAARDIQTAQQAAMVAQALSTPGQAADETQERLVPVYAQKAVDSCVNALQRLENIGANLVGITGLPAPTVPLELLDTPATRTLFITLQVATAAAEAVDRERGNVHPDGTPSGYAETIAGIAMGLRTEIYGPEGRE